MNSHRITMGYVKFGKAAFSPWINVLLRKPVFLFLLVIFPPFFLHAETIIDKLKQRAILSSESKKADIYNQLSEEYAKYAKDSALTYGKLALRLARKISYSQAEANALNNLGYANYLMESLPMAEFYINRALILSQKIQDEAATAGAMDNYG